MSTRILHLGTLFCCLGSLALGGCSNDSSEDGGVAAAGGAMPGTGGTAPGGAGPVTGGSAGAGGGTTAPVGVPLTIDGEWVDGTTNDYGIQGAFYIYSDAEDGCTETVVNWDPVTRCASGTLSPAGPAFACWGMGVGFDMNNSGQESVDPPPNVVNPYDAPANGVAGVAWTITGSAPGMGVWMTQADPANMPNCDSVGGAMCAIEGPGDGMASAPLSGSFTWETAEKADWGGTGTPYAFDPSQIIAMQFALDSQETQALPFDFCIESVSVIPAQ